MCWDGTQQRACLESGPFQGQSHPEASDCVNKSRLGGITTPALVCKMRERGGGIDSPRFLSLASLNLFTCPLGLKVC